MVRLARLAGALMLTALLAAGMTLVGSTPAQASGPLTLPDQITDETAAQVLGHSPEAQEAVDELQAETGYRLFMVFVDTFGGLDYEQWADETAELSQLGDADLLVAVAVQEENYAVNVSDASGFTDAQLDRVERQISSRLSAGDWSGAVVAGAQGLLDAATGGDGTADDGGTNGGSSGAGPGTVIFLAGLVLILVITMAVAYRRSVRRAQTQGAPGSHGPARPQAPPDPYAEVSTEALRTRAGSALVGLDDDVRTSDQELRFAQAQFGLQDTRAFKESLDQAREHLHQAFSLQRRAEQESTTEDQRRTLLIQILDLCERGEQVLDEQAEEFAELRQLERNVPRVLDELYQRAGELEGRIPAANNALTTLAVTYPEQALATISQAPEQAGQLIDAARQSIAEGRSRVDADDRGNAVSFARTAEDALAQAGGLLDSVGTASQDLRDAKGQLPDAIASITADVSDAERLAPDDAGVAQLRTEAQEAIGVAQRAGSGGDPIGALEQITAAEAALDAALEPHREAADVQQRVQGSLLRHLAAAEVKVRTVNDFVESNRGGIGAEPRTLLADAKDSLEQARRLEHTDPKRALELANESLASATRAHDGAVAAVRRWRGEYDSHSHSPYGSHDRSGGIDAGSLILGGVLGSVLRGGGRAGAYRGSSWGGGTWGGGGYGGSRRNSGGSWGGSGGGRGGFGGGFGGSMGGGRTSGGGRF